MNTTKQLVETIKEGIQEKKGSKIVIADLTHIDGTIAKYFVICQGNSPSQVEAIAESVGDFCRKIWEKNLQMLRDWEMTSGLLSTSWMYLCISSNQKLDSSMIWSTSGKMPT